MISRGAPARCPDRRRGVLGERPVPSQGKQQDNPALATPICPTPSGIGSRWRHKILLDDGRNPERHARRRAVDGPERLACATLANGRVTPWQPSRRCRSDPQHPTQRR